MTQPSMEETIKALDELRARLCDSQFCPDPISTDEEALTRYLEKTSDIKLDRVGRLIGLSGQKEDQLSWEQICQIHERALREDEQQTGTFAVWTTIAERLLSDGRRSEAERNQIATDLVVILDRAMKDNPENCAYALMMGMHYFREALRQGRKAEFIEQSRLWLNRVIEWAKEGDEQCCAFSLLYQGHCHAVLEEWQRAMMRYNAVQVELLTNHEREIAELAEGISLCRRNLEAN